ncbi:MAG: EamA family transporter [Pseudomonadota bacterium]
MSSQDKAKKNRATFFGFAAVLMWALLALFTAESGDIPPFQLAALTFCIGTLVGLVWLFIAKPAPAAKPMPKHILLLGGLGLFAYHALYFAALQNAPAAEASLIAYLWPLLIVVFSALLPGEKLRAHHVIGALLGFCGAALLISGGRGFQIDPDAAFGYGLALIAAFTWTSYSLFSRRLPDLPTQSVIVYCAITTALSIVAHLLFEVTVWPTTIVQWAAIAGLGLLPVGTAFYVWDYGLKHGDIQVIGASSYAAPLFSTIILIIFGTTDFSWPIAAACILITLGALIAAKSLLVKKSS